MRLRIATRKSPLALRQTELVAARLRTLYPELSIETLALSTRGDLLQDRSLAAIGGKGLFLKELEEAMLHGAADCAVHSLKDMPAALEPEWVLAAILARDDPGDALVSARYPDLDALPTAARVGTSSLRRQALLRATRADLQVRDLRGNINTRLAKLDAGDYDAIVLASAGLQRLGLERRIRQRLDPPTWLPAPAQGAIAVECRAGDRKIASLLAGLDDAATRTCVEAERALNRVLGGSCQVPIGAWARLDNGQAHLHGLVGDVASGRLLRATDCGEPAEPEALGRRVAQALLAKGAGELIHPQR